MKGALSVIVFLIISSTVFFAISANPVYSENDPGNVTVSVFNVNGNPASTVPGVVYGIITNSSGFQRIAYMVKSDSELVFDNLSAGNYTVYVYHYPNSGYNFTEYWGKEVVSVNSQGTTSYSFKRDMPYIDYYTASLVGKGEYNITVRVVNPQSYSINGYFYMWVNNQTTFPLNYLFKNVKLNPGLNVFNLSYSQSAPGNYYAYASIQSEVTNYYGKIACTDQYNWTEIFSIAPPPEYNVTFKESGLAPSTKWSVTLNGSTLTSTNSTITFKKPAGYYVYKINPVPGYTVSVASGSVNVTANVQISVRFTPIMYNVTFVENGLQPGTEWSVTLNGTTETSYASDITFTEPNGVYYFVIVPVNGYSDYPSSGYIRVNCSDVYQNIAFTEIYYNVTFTETGLPANALWSVTLNGSTKSTTNASITFEEPVGTYAYNISSAVGYTAFPSSGTISVTGNEEISVTFSPAKYSITFTETGLPAGTTWSVTLNGSTESSTSSSITFYVTAGTYIYTVNSVRGYSAFPQSGTIIVVNSNIVKGVIFTPVKYSVTFTESGLPSGTQWSVTLNGTTETSANSTITFSETDGSYYYTVGSVSGYVVSPASGYIIVNGSSVSQQITFVKVYSVTFTELGLPTGTLWSVTLNGTRESSTNSSITFYELAGRYYYVVGSVPGYLISQSSGMVNVAGNMKIALIFTPVMYSLTFNESGLPSGTQWSVTLNGTALSSTSQSITFIVRAGTYHYSVGNLTGYTASPATGTVKVSSNSAVNIEFSPVLVAVTFTESGLPSGTQWSVTLNGVTKTSTGSTITFMVPLGNYTYNISALSGYKLSQTSGSLKVSSPGSAPAIPVSYSALPPPALSGSLISAAFILVAVIIAVIVALSFVKRRVSAGRSKSQDTFF